MGSATSPEVCCRSKVPSLSLAMRRSRSPQRQRSSYVLGRWQQVLHNGIPPPNPPPILEVKASRRGLQVTQTNYGKSHHVDAILEDFDEYGFLLRWPRCLTHYSLPGPSGKRHRSTLIETTLTGYRRTNVWKRRGNMDGSAMTMRRLRQQEVQNEDEDLDEDADEQEDEEEEDVVKKCEDVKEERISRSRSRPNGRTRARIHSQRSLG